ncbi:unnamed protein product [Prunus armeniaca]
MHLLTTRCGAVDKLPPPAGELHSASMGWKHFVARGKLNLERGLIPPFECGDISWYFPKL